MENQNQESTPTQPNQRLGSPSQELHSTSYNEQSQKRNSPESPQHESHVSAQSPKRSRNGSLPRPSFPQEIIFEILSNLPLTNSIKKHLKRTQNDPEFSKKRVLINIADIAPRTQTGSTIKSCSLTLKSIFKDPNVNTTEIEYPSKNECHKNTVLLLNPTLRVSKRLPDIGFKKRRVILFIGLVLMLPLMIIRLLGDFPFEVFSNEAGKHVDGTLNWAVFSGQDGDFSIVSLDLARETYKEVTQPCYGDGVDERTLGVLDGCLCVLCSYRKLYADVWVMKEYGKRESWTKLVSIPYLPYERSEMFLTPVSVSKSGEILLRYGVNILGWHLAFCTFRHPSFSMFSYKFSSLFWLVPTSKYSDNGAALVTLIQHTTAIKFAIPIDESDKKWSL
ncbi:hypothetical protein ES288_A09G236200v1 [Gossypium darwinii]|uniref:F-box associated domain-containing protein n=1 Tax=Gossypium darwinii TaxID=34276 RepID=A0A5D2FCT3_GOSDA|nr:hypothetical protein ES288_A09G236200v1 [Gossypium darwinii]